MKKSIEVEDLLLYTIIVGVLVYLGFYFIITAGDLNTQIVNGRSKLENHESSSEMAQIILRYDFGTNVLISNSARNNMSFMIGSVLAIIGGMIVIRRVKTEATIGAQSANFKFNFASNSAGLSITLLGAVIICVSIIYKDRYTMTDQPAPETDIIHNFKPLSPEDLENLDLTTDD